MLLLRDNVGNKLPSLSDRRLNYFIRRQDRYHDVPYHVSQDSLTLCAELNARKIQKPFRIKVHVGLGQLAQHKLDFLLYFQS